MIPSARPRWLRWFRIVCLALAALVGSWLCGAAILTAAGAWLDVGQPPEKTDYVLVLPGGADTRPYVAAALLRAGYASEVILLKCQTTPDDLLSGNPPSYEVERRVLVSRGVALERIRVLETTTESTFTDAESLRAFLRDRPSARAAVVTNNYHTRRARFAFERVFGDERVKLRFVSAPTDRFGAADWWRHQSGISTYLREFLKSGFYFFRYGTGMTWLLVMATIFVAAIILRQVFRRRWFGPLLPTRPSR